MTDKQNDELWKITRFVPCETYPQGLPDGLLTLWLEDDQVLMIDRVRYDLQDPMVQRKLMVTRQTIYSG